MKEKISITFNRSAKKKPRKKNSTHVFQWKSCWIELLELLIHVVESRRGAGAEQEILGECGRLLLPRPGWRDGRGGGRDGAGSGPWGAQDGGWQLHVVAAAVEEVVVAVVAVIGDGATVIGAVLSYYYGGLGPGTTGG